MDLAVVVGGRAPDERVQLTPLFRDELGDALAAEGATFARVTALPFSSGAPLEMVRANLGVTVCPRWFVEQELARREVVALRIDGGLWLD